VGGGNTFCSHFDAPPESGVRSFEQIDRHGVSIAAAGTVPDTCDGAVQEHDWRDPARRPRDECGVGRSEEPVAAADPDRQRIEATEQSRRAISPLVLHVFEL